MFKEIFGTSPSSLKKGKGGGNAENTTLLLPYQRPFNFSQVISFMQLRRIKGVEIVEKNSYARTFRTRQAKGYFTVKNIPKKSALELTIRCDDIKCYMEIYNRVRQMFDLNANQPFETFQQTFSARGIGEWTVQYVAMRELGKKLVPGSPRAALEAGVGMVHQHFTLAENMSVLDNIMLGTESLTAFKSNRRGAQKRLNRLMERFGLTINPKALVKDLSVGEQQRVEILKVLYRDAKILILDEPTAVLTPQESDRLFETITQLVKEGLSVIFTTHKMREVMAASHRCIVLRQGRVVFESLTKDTDPNALAKAMVGSEIPQTIRQRQLPGNEVLALRGITLVNEGNGKKTGKKV